MAQKRLHLMGERGKGRAYLLLFEDEEYKEMACQLFDLLSLSTRTLLIQIPRVTNLNWDELTDGLRKFMFDRRLRQVSLVGFGSAATVVQNLALTQPRIVRTLVFVDATTRPHPTRLTRLLDRIEQSLPLGLPLRVQGNNFDSRPFLQRIRCPALVITTSRAEPHTKQEGEFLERRLPTAWGMSLQSNVEVEQLKTAVLDFQTVPAKIPLKNVYKASATSR